MMCHAKCVAKDSVYLCTTNVVGIWFRVMAMAFLGQITLCAAKECLQLQTTVQAPQQPFLYRILAHNVLKIE